MEDLEARKSYSYQFCVEKLQEKYQRFLLTKKEVREELQLGESTFDLYISQGKAPKSFHENGKVFYSIFDLADYLVREKSS